MVRLNYIETGRVDLPVIVDQICSMSELNVVSRISNIPIANLKPANGFHHRMSLDR